MPNRPLKKGVTKKDFDSCVKSVSAKEGMSEQNAYAICTSKLCKPKNEGSKKK